MEGMKVCLYARVSKDEKYDDNRFQDPENQLVPLRAYADAKGWIVIKEFVDRQSGADPNRPAFREMIDKGFMGGYRAILVWKLDRFSREPMNVQLAYIQKLRRNAIGLISLTESWLDTTVENPVGELILAIMTWFSAEERRKISERTKAGINRRRAIGQWKGGRPKKKGGALSVEQ